VKNIIVDLIDVTEKSNIYLRNNFINKI